MKKLFSEIPCLKGERVTLQTRAVAVNIVLRLNAQ